MLLFVEELLQSNPQNMQLISSKPQKKQSLEEETEDAEMSHEVCDFKVERDEEEEKIRPGKRIQMLGGEREVIDCGELAIHVGRVRGIDHVDSFSSLSVDLRNEKRSRFNEMK